MAVHGHTTIELTDVNTGEIEVVEEDNIVTNGYKAILDAVNLIPLVAKVSNLPWVYYKSSLYVVGQEDANIFNMTYNYFRAVNLFSNTIVEDANNYNLTNIDANLLAIAGDYVSSDDSKGSFNTTESSFSKESNRMKFVWDFATNQSNGKINSVALMPYSFGFIPYMGWASTYPAKSTSTNRRNPYFLDTYWKIEYDTIIGRELIDAERQKFSSNYRARTLLLPLSNLGYVCVQYVAMSFYDTNSQYYLYCPRVKHKYGLNKVSTVSSQLDDVWDIDNVYLDISPFDDYFTTDKNNKKTYDAMWFIGYDSVQHYIYFMLGRGNYTTSGTGGIKSKTISLIRFSLDSESFDLNFGINGIMTYDLTSILGDDSIYVYSAQYNKIIHMDADYIYLTLAPVIGSASSYDANKLKFIKLSKTNKLDFSFVGGLGETTESGVYSNIFDDGSDMFSLLFPMSGHYLKYTTLIGAMNSTYRCDTAYAYLDADGMLHVGFRHSDNSDISSSNYSSHIECPYNDEMTHRGFIFSSFGLYDNGLVTCYAEDIQSGSDTQFRVNFGCFVYTPYMLTINNLSSPVTKTSSQTMKLTYTITEDDS